jgi:hypothetical protein
MTAPARFTAIGDDEVEKKSVSTMSQAITVVLLMRRCGGKSMALEISRPAGTEFGI